MNMLLSLLLLSATPLNADQMHDLLATIDDRQSNSGDYKSLVFIEQKEKTKAIYCTKL